MKRHNQANSNPDTRESLIAKICDASNDDAWTEFVRIYQPVVQRFIQRHGLQYADAAEVAQEVLSRVARSVETWDGDQQNSTFRGWLYRITRNQTIDFLRKQRVELAKATREECSLSQIAEMNSGFCSDSSEFQAEYEKELFHWAAEKIRPSFKATNWQAFWLSTVDGHSIEEVAKQLQLECGAVYVARSRIMARLSKLIQERMAETQGLPDDSGEH